MYLCMSMDVYSYDLIEFNEEYAWKIEIGIYYINNGSKCWIHSLCELMYAGPWFQKLFFYNLLTQRPNKSVQGGKAKFSGSNQHMFLFLKISHWVLRFGSYPTQVSGFFLNTKKFPSSFFASYWSVIYISMSIYTKN